MRGWGGGLGQYTAVQLISELGETTPATPVVRVRAVDFPSHFSDHCPTSYFVLSLSPSHPCSLSTSRAEAGVGIALLESARATSRTGTGAESPPTLPTTVPFSGCGPVSRGPPDPAGEGGKSGRVLPKLPAQSGLHGQRTPSRPKYERLTSCFP